MKFHVQDMKFHVQDMKFHDQFPTYLNFISSDGFFDRRKSKPKSNWLNNQFNSTLLISDLIITLLAK